MRKRILPLAFLASILVLVTFPASSATDPLAQTASLSSDALTSFQSALAERKAAEITARPRVELAQWAGNYDVSCRAIREACANGRGDDQCVMASNANARVCFSCRHMLGVCRARGL